MDTNLLLGVAVGAALGGLVGWWLHKLGEDNRRRAIEVYFREALKISESARDRARADSEQLAERMADLREEHDEWSGRNETLQASLGGMRRKEAGAKTRIDQLKSEVAKLEAHAGQLRGEADGLRTQIQRRDGLLVRARKDLEAKDAEIVAANRQDEIDRLEAEAAELRRTHEACGVEAAELRHRIRELESHASDSIHAKLGGNGAPRWLLPSANGDQDDLRSIRGLGPVLERGLNELGIYYYRQVARMTSKDVAWIAPRLNVFPGRILREDWASQARTLHRSKYREKL